MWRWDQQEPFGNDTPNEDPDGDSIAFSFPLRFPGQYFDRETNLAYNYYRDYDPSTGRYVQSDPVGLDGGLNTFAYVGSRPIAIVDFLGLDWVHFPGAADAMRPPPSTRKVSAHCFFTCVIAKTIVGVVGGKAVGRGARRAQRSTTGFSQAVVETAQDLVFTPINSGPGIVISELVTIAVCSTLCTEPENMCVRERTVKEEFQRIFGL